jgi:hypothetical protein
MSVPATEPSPLHPNPVFARPASSERIDKAARNLELHGIQVRIVENVGAARVELRKLLPDGATVYTATSQTLETTGLADEIEKSSRLTSVRAQLAQLPPAADAATKRRLLSVPEYVVGSVHAVTEEGQVLVASATGSQLPSYAFGAEHVIWVVGAQKIVSNLEEGLRRLREYAYPKEDARARNAYGVPSALNKVLIVNGEGVPGRTTVILVQKELGF